MIALRPKDIEDAKSILLKNPNYALDYILCVLNEFDNSLNENFCSKFKNILKKLRSK